MMFNNGTNIGINVTNPTQRLDVNGAIRLRGLLYDINNQAGSADQILTRSGAGVLWKTPDFGNLTGSGTPGTFAWWTGTNSIGPMANLQYDQDNQSILLQGKTTAADDDPIFEIKNKDGIVIFGVYNEGVRINVLDEENKGSKSGFAVGSFSRETKGEPFEIMKLTSDSVRFYIPDAPAGGKSSKGGFAVGSFSRETKGIYITK